MGWGAAQKFYYYDRKCQAWVSWRQTGNTATSATFEVESYARSGDGSGYYYASDFGVRVECFYRLGSGSWVKLGSATSVLNYNDNVARVVRTVTIQRTDAAQTLRVATDAVSTTGDWPTATSSMSITISPISYSAPNAPASCAATRDSDSRASVTWSNGPVDATHPRAATLVERQDGDGGWVQVSSVPGAAANWADNSIAANRRYRYRVRARNSAGHSPYATSGYIYTTPAAPGSVMASKTGGTAVSVDAAVDAPYATGYDVQRSEDGGSTWTDIAANAHLPVADNVSGSAMYRVRSVRGQLASAWCNSNSITTIAPPNAPTIASSPDDPSASGAPATIRWSISHPDGTAQTGAEVKVTDPSGNSTVHSVPGSENSYSFVPSGTGTWTAQVRTYGLDPSAGAWSNAVSWGVYDLPQVAITSPATDGAVVDRMPIGIAWAVDDPTGVSSQALAILDSGGQAVCRMIPPASARSASVTSADAALESGSDYTVRLDVAGGSGLAQAASRAFHVEWVPPAEPSIALEEGEGRSVSIMVSSGDGGTPTQSVDVARVLPDGSLWTVAEGLSDGGACVDPLPPLGVTVEYVAVAKAASGATASARASIAIPCSEWAFNLGPGAREYISFKYNPEASHTVTRGGSAYHFADGGAGGGLPVWYGTSDLDESGSIAFDTASIGDAERLLALCRRYAVAWIRDPLGRRLRARVVPTASHGTGRLWHVMVNWDAVRFGEAW